MTILPTEINTSPLIRPSGLVAPATRWRKAWLCFAPEPFKQKVKLFERKVRFELYRELDHEVHLEYMRLIKMYKASPASGDIEDLMIEAGEIIASKLK